MNNQQFRRLLFDKPSASSSPPQLSAQNQDASPRPPSSSALGSRARPSIAMTPRHLPNSNPGSGSGSAADLFRQQLREQREARGQGAPGDGSSRSKGRSKSKTGSAAPKGSRLAAGYTDRAARLRAAAAAEEDAGAKDESSKEARVRALEEMVKLGQMEMADFERVRDEIVGGDVRDVHLVKGLDWRLLRRARAGEDVFGGLEEGDGEVVDEEEEEVEVGDVDGELEGLEGVEVRPIEREQRVKQGAMPAPVAGQKRTRDDILREMKEARARAAEEQKAAREPTLGAHFKKIGPTYEANTSRVERDEKGREVLIVVDADGNVKRKVKKQRTGVGQNGTTHALPMPDKDAKPLGMDVDVPEDTRKQEVEAEEDDDIFADAGSDYNPLGSLEEDDSDSGRSEDGEVARSPKTKTSNTAEHEEQATKDASKDASGLETASDGPRNYFGSEMDATSSGSYKNPMNDPSILDALKRASASKAADASSDQSGDQDTEKARLARMQARLAEQDRDAEDMDMGFGSSRFEDQDDGEERHVKLAKWKGLKQNDEDGEDDDQGRGGQSERKRGKKKKKADKNDASAVLGILEKRKG